MWRVFFAAVLICGGCARESAQEQFDLGVKYQNGDGVPVDSAKAALWYTKAAKRGHAPAQFNLAVMYHSGEGVSKDSAQAVYWYAEAAKHGDQEAPLILATMYDTADGISRCSKAADWFRRSQRPRCTAEARVCRRSCHGGRVVHESRVAGPHARAVQSWHDAASGDGVPKMGNGRVTESCGSGSSDSEFNLGAVPHGRRSSRLRGGSDVVQ